MIILADSAGVERWITPRFASQGLRYQALFHANLDSDHPVSYLVRSQNSAYSLGYNQHRCIGRFPPQRFS